MALGFSVHLSGVLGFSYMREPLGAPWTCEVPWFDGWELAKDERMKGSVILWLVFFFRMKFGSFMKGSPNAFVRTAPSLRLKTSRS